MKKMKTKIRKWLMRKGVEIFCWNCPAWAIRKMFPGIDHIDFRNKLSTTLAMAEAEINHRGYCA